MSSHIEHLKQISLFKNITDFELKNIIPEIHIYKKEYKKGGIILLQGEPYNELYIIINGKCSGEMVDASGKTVKIEEFSAPHPLAAGILFAEKNFLPVSVIAKTDMEVLTIGKGDILKLCALSKTFLKNMLSDISDKFVFISTKISFLQFKSIKEKFVNYISALPKSNTGEIILPDSIEELSTLFGVSRPSLSRAISELESDGIISKKNKKIKILDAAKVYI
jgi:CRP/FNR family transcriptional regulator, dissimilatory nitrate respiration regulator